MKKFLTFILVLLFAANIFAASTVRIINFTTNYTLYFDIIAGTPMMCYPELQTENNAGGSYSSYCILAPMLPIEFSNFTELSFWYPNLMVRLRQGQTLPPSSPQNPNDADTLLDFFGMDWSYVIAKAESTYSPFTDGAWIGWNDFVSCHGLQNNWSQHTTATVGPFTIGAFKYFILAEN